TLEKAVATADKAGVRPKAVRDFRELLADKSIDAVCISTPDHWHAYMTVEACKQGKDVFVEKPASTWVEEGRKMVEAARKYNRVVQAGTMQRSGGYFKKAAEIVKSGVLGEITFCHTWQTGATPKKRWGRPADGPVPAGLDWDMWLGPAPKVPFNPNRWGVGVTTFPTFHYPRFLLTYESRTANPMPMFGEGAATSIHGTEGTLVVRRGACYLIPN